MPSQIDASEVSPCTTQLAVAAPAVSCADFYAKLPELVRRVVTGDIPAAQRGDHDLNASMVDWSEATAALRQNRWWKRLFHLG